MWGITPSRKHEQPIWVDYTERDRHCFVCGRFGRKIPSIKKFECSSCDVSWSPIPNPNNNGVFGKVKDANGNPYVDHSQEWAPCP